MSKPAACLGDAHTCPMVNPGPAAIPHVGMPIVGPGAPTVLIGGKPAAVQGDMCPCVGPPDSIAAGSSGVFFEGKPAARMGDPTAHGGVIVGGNPTVLIGESGGGGGGGGGGGESEAEALEMTETDFLEIKLQNEEGQMVPFAPYKIVLPDGSEKKGRLNGDGYAYVNVKEPGDCKVVFSELDETDWQE